MSETKPSAFSDNAAAAFAYITFVPAVVFLFLPPYNARPFVRFHAWQSIILSAVAFLLSALLSFGAAPLLLMGAAIFMAITWIVWALWFGNWIMCAVCALNGKRFKIPLLGILADKWA